MSNAIERVTTPSAPAPSHVGQATAVEQSRAVAEVQAAVYVAQQMPRSVHQATAEMEQSCRVMAMAERAFFRFSRGGGTVSGPSVHLMRELARCFGNVQYGIAELRRDDAAGFSEMQAYAWDVQTNTRSAQVFVVPHKRDKRGGPESLVDLRDIYENNANQGARRLREAIRSILPPWYVEQAIELCNATLRDGGGKPLPQRIADAIRAFDGIGVKVDQLEDRMDRGRDKWTEHDIAQLGIIHRSIQRGEVRAEEEFPARRVTADEIKTGGKGSGKRAELRGESGPELVPTASESVVSEPEIPDPHDGNDPWSGQN